MNLAHIGTRHERVDLIDGGSPVEADTIELEIYVNGDLFYKTGVLTPAAITAVSIAWDTDHHNVEYTYELPYGAEIQERIYGTYDSTTFSDTINWSVDVPPDAFKWKLIAPSTLSRDPDRIVNSKIRAFAISLQTGQPIATTIAPVLDAGTLVIQKRTQKSLGEWEWSVSLYPDLTADAETVTLSVSGEDLRGVEVQTDENVVTENIP